MSNIAFHYDAFNDFGTLSAAGDYPNTINMGEASAERMTVDLKLPEGSITSADGVKLSVKGSDTESGAYETIVESGTVTPEMINDGYGLPIPKTKFKYLKAAIGGNFDGKVQAIINSYLGK